MRPLPTTPAASRRTTRDLLLVGVAALLVGVGLLFAFRAGRQAEVHGAPQGSHARRLLEALLARAEAEAQAVPVRGFAERGGGDTPDGDEADDEAQPGDDVLVDDSPAEEQPRRWRRARRVIHLRAMEVVDGFEDEVIEGHVAQGEEVADEGEWGYLEGDEPGDSGHGRDRDDGDEGGDPAACSASLPCLLASSFGDARPPLLPASTGGGGGWSSAREALRSGRYRDAAAGFARAAADLPLPNPPPNGSGSPRTRAAAERRLLCRMAAVALLADPARDAGLVDTRGVVQAVAADTLGECAPELVLLLGRSSPRGQPPDTTHL